MSTLTPNAKFDDIVGIFPDFKEYWESEGDHFRTDDGSFTFHGLFAVLSHYVRDNYSQMSEGKRAELFRFIEACISNGEADGEIVDAIHTCFLENLSDDIPAEEAGSYMQPETRKMFNYYDV